MDQQWLTVLGLALDFAGFAMLLREWWLGFYLEGSRLDHEAEMERVRALRHLSRAHRDPTERNPYESLERLQDETAVRKAREAAIQTRLARRGIFLTAAFLIVTGFLLQIVGAVPGCCPPWIAPQG
jgi:hypothetical protein